MQKQFLHVSILISTLLIFNSCEKTPGHRMKFNDGWKFCLLDESNYPEDEFHLAGFDDSGWEPVQLPHTAHREPLLVNNQWQGICWYRKDFHIPGTYTGKKIFLELEGAMNYSRIWINGNRIGEHHGGYLPVVLDITEHVIPNSQNSIAVRLDNTDNPITGPKPLKILDFNMYGGLYRSAWLTVKDKVYISHPSLAEIPAGGGVFITSPKVSEENSRLRVNTHIVNEETEMKSVELVHTVFYGRKKVTEVKAGPATIQAGKGLELKQHINITNARLWSPSSPSLYVLETTVIADGRVTDTERTRFGIRKFRFRDNQLYINGEKTFLRGTNRHQEYPFIGYAMSDRAQYRDAKKIKEAGFNFIRLSHYPHSPAFMDACDQYGILTLDAILGWQYYNDDDRFREYCYNSARELIRRDRNHPSVLAWEVSLNETRMPVFFMEELHRITHEEYPGKHTWSAGWQDDVYDIYVQARQHRIKDHYEEPVKPYIVSEYGDWEYYSNNPGLNQHRLPPEKRYETSSRQKRGYGETRLLQQATNIQEAHNDNFNTPAFADAYWVMFDYNRGYHDDIEFSGIMDIFRIPKFSYWFYKSQADPAGEAVVRIASYWNEDSPLDVRVFSNCHRVELYLNGEKIAGQEPDTGKNTGNLPHPPFTFSLESFEPGELKAVGLIDGKPAAEHSVRTPGEAAALKIWLDESGMPPKAGCNDVLFLYIAATDGNGTIIPDFSELIELEIDGEAEIMNTGMIEAEAGIGTALIRIGNTKGKIGITASSGKLDPARFRLKAE